MYQELELWKQVKLDKEAKELQRKIAVKYEFDKWLKELCKKNGTTKY